MQKRSGLSLTAVLLAGALGFTGVQADDDPLEAAIEYRQASFQVMKYNIGPMADMLKGDIEYDQAAMEKNAEVLAMMSTIIDGLFPEGSDALAGDTAALADIWAEPEAFEERMAEFQQATQALVSAAATEDRAQIAAALEKTGSSCRACHDDFRD